jgi:hypothetical protein
MIMLIDSMMNDVLILTKIFHSIEKFVDNQVYNHVVDYQNKLIDH